MKNIHNHYRGNYIVKKKLMITLSISGLFLAACENGGEAQLKDLPNQESQAEQAAAEESTNNEIYFDGTTAETNDLKIEITDYKIIPAGSEGNEYNDDPAVAFWYDITNKSDKEIDPRSGWYNTFSVVQDNDPNLINELTIHSMNPDEQYHDSQLQIIKRGGTVSNAISYILTDTETPVTLTATQGILGEEIGSHDFEVNK